MPSSDETFERSLSAMEDTSVDEEVRVQAVLVLARQGGTRAIEPLVNQLRHGEGAVRFDSADALARIGTAAVPPLLDALSDEQGEVRFWAARALPILTSMQEHDTSRRGSVRALIPGIGLSPDGTRRRWRSTLGATLRMDRPPTCTTAV